MKSARFFSLAFLILIFAFSTLLYAGVPQMINYQGKLTTPGGALIDSTLSMVFSIYDNLADVSPVWAETLMVQVEKGIFSVVLGNVHPLTNDLFDGTVQYLGVKAGTDSEMTPRKEIVSVGYAQRAAYAEVAVSDGDWNFRITDTADTTLVTGGEWGIARAGNTLYGNADFTHVNLGVACTTGTSGQNYNYCTVAGGYLNTASGINATVGGGYSNTASGSDATVGGGYYNVASVNFSTVAGGYADTASGQYAAIGGGMYNKATSSLGVVAGGQSNTASGTNHSTVGGGYSNTASANYSTVAGGYINTASGQFANVGGGDRNTASGILATVAGGGKNAASANYSTVAGGYADTASGQYANVGGGLYNTASGTYSTVGGGVYNTASEPTATVSGGYADTASGEYSTVAGGHLNSATNSYATVGGGQSNKATSSCGAVAGGQSNTASGTHQSTVGGGYGNTASANYSTVAGGYVDTASGEDATVPGGRYNTAAGRRSFAAGYRAKANHDGAFVWADNTAADFASTGTNQFLIRASGGVGIGTNNPLGFTLAVNGTAAKPGGGLWSIYSDLRLKEIKAPYDYGLSQILKLDPVRYNYREGNELDLPAGGEYVGLIAQDVQKVIPEAVEENDSGYLMLKSDPIIWAMLNAIKELKAENEELKKRMEELENKE